MRVGPYNVRRARKRFKTTEGILPETAAAAKAAACTTKSDRRSVVGTGPAAGKEPSRGRVVSGCVVTAIRLLLGYPDSATVEPRRHTGARLPCKCLLNMKLR
jgi:hypothetical protein